MIQATALMNSPAELEELQRKYELLYPKGKYLDHIKEIGKD
ncbi:MAG: hypothetical protein AAF738_03560 [Bacteroidota bacterium]